jgi:predicted Zn-dependent protease
MRNFFLAATALMLSGCASMGTYNPATGKSELIYISTPAEVSMGRDIHASLQSQYRFSESPKYRDRLNRVGEDIIIVSDRQDVAYQFFAVEDNELNAFTIPGCNVYVFTGLMDKLSNDDQLAAVLAHEIGHCAARHSVKKFQAALGYDLIGRILLSQIDGGAAQIAALSTNAIMSIVFSSYSRKDEYEADRLAVKYTYLAGYDPQAIIATFEMLKANEKEGVRAPQILRSHPYLQDRISAVSTEIANVRSRYDESAPER